MFRAGLLLIIRTVNITHDYINCCLYTVDPPHDKQQACSKHVEVCY